MAEEITIPIDDVLEAIEENPESATLNEIIDLCLSVRSLLERVAGLETRIEILQQPEDRD